MNLLLLSFQGERQRMALLEDGRLLEYREQQALAGPQPEDIYLGKVGRVMKGLGAAFVGLTPKEEGFLPFNRIPGGQQPQPGDCLMVQVRRPPQGGKGAFLTGDIALPGSLAVLLPLSGGARVSRRVKDQAAKERLLGLSRRLKPRDMGLIVRSEAAEAEEEAVAREVEELLHKWQGLLADAQALTAPAPLLAAPSPLHKLLREAGSAIDAIVTDDLEQAEPLGLPVRYAADPMSLNRVPHQLRTARGRRVPLKSGAELVIDPCEAMTVIDVNTAGRSLGKDRERAMLETNLLAAREIPRLLRLRRVGGMVLVDFIDMPSQQHRDQVTEALARAAAQDPSPIIIHGFTSLGLLELTRARQEEALATQILRPCPTCGGTGYTEETSHDHP